MKLAFNLDNPAIVPHMAYRVKNNNIELSLQRIESYPSLNDCFNSDFDDYFNVYKGTRDKINLTIEIAFDFYISYHYLKAISVV